MVRVMIWGIGKIYNEMRNLLSLFEMKKEIMIVGITGLDVPNHKELDGYSIYNCYDIKQLNFDYIIVMSDFYYNEIYKEIVDIGIDPNRILKYIFLQLPNIDINEYLSLKSRNVTIISDNCWGGYVYKTLGLRCMSPTRNVSFTNENYIKLLNDFEGYMQVKPTFKRWEVNSNSGEKFPVLKCKDIEIRCNHEKDIEKAVYEWEKRKKRINYNDLFIEMHTEDRIWAKKFLELDQYKNKICFVPWETNEEGLIQIKKSPKQKNFYDAVNNTALFLYNENWFDIVALLNGNKKARFT